MKKRKVWVGVVASVVVIATVAAIVMIPKMKKNPVTVVSVSTVSYPDFGPGGGGDSFGQVTTDQVQTAFLSDTQVVKEVMVEQGQKVSKGDILYTYDTTLSDLALERKGIEIRQKEVELKRARAELTRLNGLRPMSNVPGSVVPPTESGEQKIDYNISPEKDKLGTAYAGEGKSVMDPRYFWLREGQEITDELIDGLMKNDNTVYVVFQIAEGDAELTPFALQYGVQYTREAVDPGVPEPETTDPTTQPTDPETQPTDPGTNPTAPETKPSEPETNPTAPTTQPTDPTTQPTTAPETTAPETTAPAPAPRRTGALHSDSPKFRYKMMFFDYTKANMPEDEGIPEFPDVDMGSGYTQEELAELRLEQKKQIRELEFNLRMGEAELKIMEKEASNGEVAADFDGIVVSVITPEEAKGGAQPLLKVAGGGGYYVEGSVSELELTNVKPGQSVIINNWDTGMVYEGTIAEIGQYPVENRDFFYGSSSENVTYYPYRVFIDESADLMEGSYVNLTYQADASAAGYMNLDNAFLRTDGKKSYVYVRGEDGKLEKRYVQIGSSRDGYATPIVSGLSDMDYIAFPYGKDVRDGAATVEGTMEDLING